MNYYCCVPHCSSWIKKNPDINFHVFPVKGKHRVFVENKFGKKELMDRLKAWVLKLKIGKPISKFMRVCSLHFCKDDYFFRDVNSKKRRILKKIAVPSKNLPSLQNDMVVETSSRRIRRSLKERVTSINSQSNYLERQNMDAETDPLAITPADNLALFGGSIDNIEFVVESDEDSNDDDIKDDSIIEIDDSEEQDTEEVVEATRFLNIPCVTIADGDIIDLDVLDVKEEITIAEMDLKPILDHQKQQFEMEAADDKSFHGHNSKKQCEIERTNVNPIPSRKKQSGPIICEKLVNASQDGVQKIRCFVPGCTTEISGPNSQNKGVYWFNVPIDANLRKIWGICIERSDKTLTQGDVVCHKHFSDDDIVHQITTSSSNNEVVSYESKLRQGAVPCIEFHDECCVSTCKRKTGNMYCFPILRVSDFHLWIYMIKNPLLKTLKMKEVLRYRVCDIHFDSDCFDGDFLLKSAVPTLYLPDNFTVDCQNAKKINETNIMNKAQNNIVLICAHGECPNRSNGDKNLFRFPKDTDRCMAWLRACGRHDLITTPEQTFREMSYLRLGVCEEHFDIKDFESTTAVLKSDAMPKSYVVGQSDDFKRSKAVSRAFNKNPSGSSNASTNVVGKNVVSAISSLQSGFTGVCAYRGCQSKESAANPLFSFPLEKERSQKWRKACGLLNMKLNITNMRICSKHFDKDMFHSSHILKDDAIPVNCNLHEKMNDKEKTSPETTENDQQTVEHDASDTAVQKVSESVQIPVIYCAVANCDNYSSAKRTIIHSKFPDPKKDPQRFNVWLKLVANSKLAYQTPEEIYNGYLVCWKHFDPHFYQHYDITSKLSDEAVPTKNLTGDQSWFLTSDYYINRLQNYFDTLNAKGPPLNMADMEWKEDLSQDVEECDDMTRCILEKDRIRFPGMKHYLYMGKRVNLNKRKIPYNVYNSHNTGYGLNNKVEVGENIKIHTAIIIDDDDECERQVLQQLLDKRRKNS